MLIHTDEPEIGIGVPQDVRMDLGSPIMFDRQCDAPYNSVQFNGTSFTFLKLPAAISFQERRKIRTHCYFSRVGPNSQETTFEELLGDLKG